MNLNFHHRLLLYTYLPTALVIVVMTLVFALQQHNSLERQFQEHLIQHSESSLKLVVMALKTDSLTDALHEASRSGKNKSVTLYDNQGQQWQMANGQLAHQGQRAPDRLDSFETGIRTGINETIRTHSLPEIALSNESESSEFHAQWLRLSYDHQKLQYDQLASSFRFFIIGLMLLAGLYWLMNWILQIFSKPVEQIFYAQRFYAEHQIEYLVDSQSRIPEFISLQNLINDLNLHLRSQQLEFEERLQENTLDLRKQIENYEEQNIRLQNNLKEARDAESIKSQFLAQMSHDMRTPLNAILGFSSILSATLSKEASRDRENEYLNRIINASRSLVFLVNNILEYSRLRADRLQLTLKPISLVSCIEDVIAQLSSQANSKKIKLSYSLAREIDHEFHLDYNKLKQVLVNLVNNAIKFSDKGTVRIEVTGQPVSSVPGSQGNQLLYGLNFSVQDQGIGIEQQKINRLFQPYAQQDQGNNQEQGSGLGLSICRKLVDLMKGEIKVSSLVGKGSNFSFDIQAELVKESTADKQQATEGVQEVARLYLRTSDEQQMYDLTNLALRLGIEVLPISDNCLEQMEEQSQLLYCLSDQELSNPPLSHLAKQLTHCQITLILPWPVEKITQGCQTMAISYVVSPVLSYQFKEVLLGRPKMRQLSINKRVLIVDDNSNNRRMLEVMINHLPLNIEFASSGEEAIRLMHSLQFDLIFMDIQMPGLNGIETMKFIRSQQQYRNLPIIAVTAQTDNNAEYQLKKDGFDDYLAKPFSQFQVEQQLHRWLMANSSQPAISSAEDMGIYEPQIFDPISTAKRYGYRYEICLEMMEGLFATLEKIQDELFELQGEELNNSLHWLKGSCNMLGVPRLNQILETCELAAKQNSSELPEIMDILRQEIEDILALQGSDWQQQLHKVIASQQA